MSTHDEFQQLSARVTKAEENIKTASAQNMDDLRKRVHEAGDSAQKSATGRKTHTANAEQKASDGWSDVQDRWSGHVASIRSDIGDRKNQHGSKHAEHHAERARSATRQTRSHSRSLR